MSYNSYSVIGGVILIILLAFLLIGSTVMVVYAISATDITPSQQSDIEQMVSSLKNEEFNYFIKEKLTSDGRITFGEYREIKEKCDLLSRKTAILHSIEATTKLVEKQ